jgi:LEA14-like dessication related protein
MNSAAKKIIPLVITAMAVIYGCSNYRDIRLEEVELQTIRLKSTSGADVYLNIAIYNPTSSEIKVSNINGTIYRDGVKFAEITLKEETTIPPKARSEVIVPLNVKFLDPLSLLAIGLDINALEKNNFTADVKITAKDGMLKKNFNKNGISLNKYLKKIKIK